MSYEILDEAVIDGFRFGLVKITENSYFTPSGKARLKLDVKYNVEIICDSLAALGHGPEGAKQRFWIKSKAEAKKYFESLKSKAVTVQYEGKAAANHLNKLFGC